MTLTPDWERDGIALYLGDCLDVLPQVEPGSVQLIVTSPPYGVGKAYEAGANNAAHDGLLRGFVAASARVLDGNGHLFINVADRLTGAPKAALPAIDGASVASGMVLWDVRVWKKSPAWITSPWHAVSTKAVQEWEYLVTYRKPGVPAATYAITDAIRHMRMAAGLSNKQIDSAFGFNGMSGHWTSPAGQAAAPTQEQWRLLKTILGVASHEIDGQIAAANRPIRGRLTPDEWVEWGSRGVWEIPSVYKAVKHPAMFPLLLPTRAVRLLTFDGDTVLVHFMGSGTTGDACVQTGRRFIGIEKEPKYFDIAVKRIEAALAVKPDQLNLVGATT